MVLGRRYAVSVLLDPAAFNFLNLLNYLVVDPVLIVHKAVGIRDGQDRCAQLGCLLRSVGSHVTGTRNLHALTSELFTVSLQHGVRVVQQAKAGCFRTGQTTTVAQTLTGQNARLVPIEAAILAEHVANLAATNADIAGRHVHVGTNILL